MTSKFEILESTLSGLKVLQRLPRGDSRGYFERLFCEEELHELLNHKQIVQINHTSTTSSGTVRGLHYQCPPHAEVKLVSCLRGEVFDVAVDIRLESPTFLNWHAEILSAENHRTMVIPEGFAHGFQALSDNCELLYLHTSAYAQHAEAGLRYDDARLGIDWPLGVTDLSDRDIAQASLPADFAGVDLG